MCSVPGAPVAPTPGRGLVLGAAAVERAAHIRFGSWEGDQLSGRPSPADGPHTSSRRGLLGQKDGAVDPGPPGSSTSVPALFSTSSCGKAGSETRAETEADACPLRHPWAACKATFIISKF